MPVEVTPWAMAAMMVLVPKCGTHCFTVLISTVWSL